MYYSKYTKKVIHKLNGIFYVNEVDRTRLLRLQMLIWAKTCPTQEERFGEASLNILDYQGMPYFSLHFFNFFYIYCGLGG